MQTVATKNAANITMYLIGGTKIAKMHYYDASGTVF